MKYVPSVALVVVAVIVAWNSPALAQNRTESQILLELRTLHEQVQRLQLGLNAVTEQVKNAEARLDAQAGETRKGFADQKMFADGVATTLKTLSERENDATVRLGQLNQEMRAIRDGLTLQQTMLNEIVGLMKPIAGAMGTTGGNPGDPATSAEPPTTAPKPGSGIPPSPTVYYNQAFLYFYKTEYDLAVDTLADAIKRFPDHPEAARAQYTIGEANHHLGKHKEALAAFAAVIARYKDPDVLPDAWYKQGLMYQQLGQNEAAVKSFNHVIANFKDSSSAFLATSALRQMKVIK